MLQSVALYIYLFVATSFSVFICLNALFPFARVFILVTVSSHLIVSPNNIAATCMRQVIGISACYYASQAAGIQKEEELSINAAVERLQKKHSQLVPQLDEKLASGKDVQERLKKNKRFFVTLSNVTIQVSIHVFVRASQNFLQSVVYRLRAIGNRGVSQQACTRSPQ